MIHAQISSQKSLPPSHPALLSSEALNSSEQYTFVIENVEQNGRNKINHHPQVIELWRHDLNRVGALGQRERW